MADEQTHLEDKSRELLAAYRLVRDDVRSLVKMRDLNKAGYSQALATTEHYLSTKIGRLEQAE